MNWLHPLTEKILAERTFPGEQRRALVLWVNELSAICDQHVPRAPVPELESFDSTRIIQVTWSMSSRYFAMGVTPSLRLLLAMRDSERAHIHEEPTHQELKRNVLCLFDGWTAS